MTLARKVALERKTPIRRKSPKPRRVAASCVVRGCRRRPVPGVDLCASHARKEADRLFSLIIRASNGGRCIRCGKPATDTSHIASRRYLPVRWLVENAEPMCRGCHHWQHMHPLENEVELHERLGYSLEILKQRALAGGRPNWPTILADLRSRLGEPTA